MSMGIEGHGKKINSLVIVIVFGVGGFFTLQYRVAFGFVWEALRERERQRRRQRQKECFEIEKKRKKTNKQEADGSFMAFV